MYTITDLEKFENQKKIANPYFRKSLPRWREAALFLLNEDMKTTDIALLYASTEEIDDYVRVIVEDQTFKDQLLTLKKKALEIFKVRFESLDEVQPEEQEDDYES